MAIILMISWCIHSRAETSESLLIYGRDKASSNQVLALVALPKVVSLDDDLSELSYQVISRGVSNPSSAKGSVLFWRNSILWRWDNGHLRQVTEEENPFGVTTGDALQFVGENGNPNPLIVWRKRTPSAPEGTFKTTTDILNGSDLLGDLLGRTEGSNTEPVGWIADGSLVIRRWKEDPIGRVTQSHLEVLYNYSKNLRIERLNDFPDTTLEISPSVSGNSVAFQTYDSSTKLFHLWTKKIGLSAQQIPVASHPVRGTEFYRKSFEEFAVRSLRWDTTGRYLEVYFLRGGWSLWDNKDGKWLSWGKSIIFEPVSSSTFITWARKNEAYVSNILFPFVSSLSVKSFNENSIHSRIIGTVKGIEIQAMFLTSGGG